MTVLFSFRLIAFASAAFCSCTAQAQVKQPRRLADFQVVRAGGGIDVFLTQGPTARVVVEAAADAQSHVLTEVQGGTLTIGWESGYSWKNLLSKQPKVNVYVTCPRLTGLALSGGSDAKSESTITADEFQLQASGGSDVQLTLMAKSLTSTASGGSDIDLTGRVERQRVEVSGGSDYNAFALQSATADVRASGGSDVSVSVTGELSSSASGGSEVRYKGAARLRSSASGGSRARRVE